MAPAVQVRKLDSADAVREHLASLGVEIPLDAEVDTSEHGPLRQPLDVGEHRVGNRFCVLPMEGWDGTADGRPTDLVRRRWQRFGQSGAKLVWGGEAVAVREDGRANSNQLRIGADTVDELAELRELLVATHAEHHGDTDDLLVGLQLTHSGRWARPDGSHLPRTAYRHPLLDPRVNADDGAVLDDGELDELVGDFVAAAGLAADAGFAFVDVKHCHGYLGHELLSAVDRDGAYGGDLDGRTAFLRRVIEGIRRDVPGLDIAVRVSIFDFVPFEPDDDGLGTPVGDRDHPYRFAFGGDGSGLGIDLAEPDRLLSILADLGVELVCTTAGSPYYNPHVQRPAYFPPSDGYTPPEDPLVGVARQVAATAELAARHPELVMVGSGYSYLQEWLPNVAQAVVREGGADAVGLGRMMLSYPNLPSDVLDGEALDRRHLCRTFSDCTTAPRNGVVSGCYPLDDFYKKRDERVTVTRAKKAMPGGPARA
ncbi:MAG: NADH:flavin oxidoreductase [Acidimicrobiia bacterium]|nr:NADH:flavin oxidoreductase [Acidimicrobiia bacterium]